MAEDSTRTRLLDAGERLFAEYGLNGVSLRQINAAADANSAALHYHFGSKEALVEAILLRRMQGTYTHRRALLDAIESTREPPQVRRVVEAMVLPLGRLLRGEGEAGRNYVRFLARLQSDGSARRTQVEARYFGEDLARLYRALKKTLPDLPPKLRQLRISLTVDAMLHTLANADLMTHRWTSEPPARKLDELLLGLVDYLAGGLAAPVEGQRQEPPAEPVRRRSGGKAGESQARSFSRPRVSRCLGEI